MQDPTPKIQKALLSLKNEFCPHEICSVHSYSHSAMTSCGALGFLDHGTHTADAWL